MPAISLHKQMAMGKGYPTAKKICEDPSPTPGLPDANYKTMAKMTTDKGTGAGGGYGGTNSQRGRGPNQVSTVMGGR